MDGARLRSDCSCEVFRVEKMQIVHNKITLAANLEPEKVNEVTAPRMARREKILANIVREMTRNIAKLCKKLCCKLHNKFSLAPLSFFLIFLKFSTLTPFSIFSPIKINFSFLLCFLGIYLCIFGIYLLFLYLKYCDVELFFFCKRT